MDTIIIDDCSKIKEAPEETTERYIIEEAKPAGKIFIASMNMRGIWATPVVENAI